MVLFSGYTNLNYMVFYLGLLLCLSEGHIFGSRRPGTSSQNILSLETDLSSLITMPTIVSSFLAYTPISLASAATTMAKLVQIAEKRHGSQYERDTNGVSVAEVPRSAKSGTRRRLF